MKNNKVRYIIDGFYNHTKGALRVPAISSGGGTLRKSLAETFIRGWRSVMSSDEITGTLNTP